MRSSIADTSLAEKIRPILNGGSDRDKHLDSLFSGRIPPALRALSGDIDALNLHLDDYATSGGIPWIIDQLSGQHTIPESSYTTYLDLMLADMVTFERKEEIVKEIVSALVKSTGWPVSWTSLSKDLGLPNATYAFSYVSVLESMFMLSIIYQYNTKTKLTIPGKNKKVYFVDPFYFHALHGWIVSTEAYYLSKKFLRDGQNMGHIVEGIVANHLIRMAFRRSSIKSSFLYTNYLAYWRYGPDKEVDFVYKDGGVEIPIEVKFGRNLNKRDLDGIIAFKKATRTKTDLFSPRASFPPSVNA